MKYIFIACTFVFLFSLIPLTTFASKPNYEIRYEDLSKKDKLIADKIMKQVRTYNGPAGRVKIEDIAVLKQFDDLKKITHAVNRTYFPYIGKLQISTYYRRHYGNKTKGLFIFSINIDMRKTQAYLRMNEADRKIMKKWVKACTNKKMGKKKKATEIAKYIAKKTKYQSKDSNNVFKEADTLLRKKKGNCRAASRLYIEMCKEAGISTCRFVSGSLRKIYNQHAWNTLVIGGKRYYTDVTLYRTYKDKKTYILAKKLPKKYIFPEKD